VDKKEQRNSIIDQMHIQLSTNCSDVDSNGRLWVETVRKHQEEQEHMICRYSPVIGEAPMQQSIKGTKQLLRVFKHYVIEIKKERNQNTIFIYDFQNEMILFTSNYMGIISLEIENDAIYMLCMSST
jgi:hypothetical protein